ncbi:MAG: hypothetical protein ABW168_23770 [Sedimenticola sp.]
MIIDIGIEEFLIEFVDQLCPFLRDVMIAEVLADNRAVLAFHQYIIVGSSEAGFGEFNQ